MLWHCAIKLTGKHKEKGHPELQLQYQSDKNVQLMRKCYAYIDVCHIK